MKLTITHDKNGVYYCTSTEQSGRTKAGPTIAAAIGNWMLTDPDIQLTFVSKKTIPLSDDELLNAITGHHPTPLDERNLNWCREECARLGVPNEHIEKLDNLALLKATLRFRVLEKTPQELAEQIQTLFGLYFPSSPS